MARLKAEWRSKNEIIAEWAYYVYLNRTAYDIPGDADSDWLQAQREYEDTCERSRIELIEFLKEEIVQVLTGKK